MLSFSVTSDSEDEIERKTQALGMAMNDDRDDFDEDPDNIHMTEEEVVLEVLNLHGEDPSESKRLKAIRRLSRWREIRKRREAEEKASL